MTALPASSPHEQRVLGYALAHHEWLPWLALHSCARDFHMVPHRVLYEHLIRLEPANGCDIADLVASLRATESLEAVGGAAGLAMLSDEAAVTSADAERAVERLVALRRIRQIIAAARQIDREGPGRSADDIDAFCGWAESTLYDALHDAGGAPSLRPLTEVIRQTLAELEAAQARGDEVSGVPTDFESLDYITGGWQAGDLVILAARPAMGKTALAGAWAWRAARAGHPVLFATLEMSDTQLVQRMLAAKGGVNTRDMRTASISSAEWDRLYKAAERLSEGDVWLCEEPSLTVEQLGSLCRLQRARGSLGLVIVDYLQILHSRGRHHTREREIAAMSSGLKRLAKELRVPVVVLSQLNRDLEKRQNKRPILADLRDSGAIEQDADVVVFLHREEEFDPDTDDRGVAEIRVAKQRKGPTGLARLAWVAEYTRFEEIHGTTQGDLYAAE